MTDYSGFQFWKKLIELQENTDRQFEGWRNKINEQNKYFTKEIEISKKNHIEILEMKNSIKEIKNELVSIENKARHLNERICDIDDENLEMMQREEREISA